MTLLVGSILFLLLVMQTWRLNRRRVAEIAALNRTSAAQMAKLRATLGNAEQRAASFAQVFETIDDGIIVCDAAERIALYNPAARAICGNPAISNASTIAAWAAAHGLRYPSGQTVPQGAVPFTRALSGHDVERAEYLLLGNDGVDRRVEITACCLHPGDDSTQPGAFAILRDVTGERLRGQLVESTQARARELSAVSQRISMVDAADDAYRAIVEGARRIAEHSGVVAQVHLYGLRDERQRITLLSAAPGDAHNSVRTKAPAPPRVWAFDAQSSLLWSLYVEKRPVISADIIADERFSGEFEQKMLSASPPDRLAGSALLLPLSSKNVVVGHLSLMCPSPSAFEDAPLQADLTQLASLTAIADVSFVLQQSVQRQSEAISLLSTLGRLVAVAAPVSELADAVTSAGTTLFHAELCVLSLWENANDDSRLLRRQGRVYTDALVDPSETGLGAGCGTCDSIPHKAATSGKPVSRVGLKNPAFGQCAFRAFGGQSGTHSVFAFPVRPGKDPLGVLTLYRSGNALLSGDQTVLMETLAALVTSGIGQHRR